MLAKHKRTILSGDRVYRYILWRECRVGFLTSNGHALFICLNPSTADEVENDHTVRKCMGFVERWNLSALCIVNLFAVRTSDPEEMKRHPEPVGPCNDQWLRMTSRHAKFIVAAWGAHGGHMRRDRQVLNLINREVLCLRTTKDNFPEHPLYVPYETKLRPYSL
jgi:hypothetical protein